MFDKFSFKNIIVSLDSTIEEVMFRLQHFGLIILVVEGEILKGVITQRDLLSSFEKNKERKALLASDICNYNYRFVYADNIESMISEFISPEGVETHFLPVIDCDRKLITVINIHLLNEYDVWRTAQKYEFHYWSSVSDTIKYADSLIKQLEKNDTAKSLNLWNISEQINSEIHNYICDKNCLEIGCGPLAGFLADSSLDNVKQKYVIEPLAKKYDQLIKDICGVSLFEKANIEVFNVGGDKFISALENKIDGLIICHNALDHTPDWVFVLSNIASYATKGSYLYLFTDIYHPYQKDSGHFNITLYEKDFLRLVERLGYRIIFNTFLPGRESINVLLLAIKE